MRQKISTLIEPGLYRRVKLEGKALEGYLKDKGRSPTMSGVVAESWGVLKPSPEQVSRILAEEDGLFES